jgi:hypothetical protein
MRLKGEEVKGSGRAGVIQTSFASTSMAGEL